mmetsp:Transcript_22793/g.57473  ORF Transcript_22793/g.57473 Transcript_22793/m.57473 type:complete len:311 (-) Transcript_22793:80-1012(-)
MHDVHSVPSTVHVVQRPLQGLLRQRGVVDCHRQIAPGALFVIVILGVGHIVQHNHRLRAVLRAVAGDGAQEKLGDGPLVVARHHHRRRAQLRCLADDGVAYHVWRLDGVRIGVVLRVDISNSKHACRQVLLLQDIVHEVLRRHTARKQQLLEALLHCVLGGGLPLRMRERLTLVEGGFTLVGRDAVQQVQTVAGRVDVVQRPAHGKVCILRIVYRKHDVALGSCQGAAGALGLSCCHAPRHQAASWAIGAMPAGAGGGVSRHGMACLSAHWQRGGGAAVQPLGSGWARGSQGRAGGQGERHAGAARCWDG